MIRGLCTPFSALMSKDLSTIIKQEGKVNESISMPGCCCLLNE